MKVPQILLSKVNLFSWSIFTDEILSRERRFCTRAVVTCLCSGNALVRNYTRLRVSPQLSVFNLWRKSVSDPPKHRYHTPHYLLRTHTRSHTFCIFQVPKNHHCHLVHSCVGIWTVHSPNRSPLDSPNDHSTALPLLQAPSNPPECPLAIHGSALRVRSHQPDCWMSSPTFHHRHRGRRQPCCSRLRPRPSPQHRPWCAIVHVLGPRRYQRRVWTP